MATARDIIKSALRKINAISFAETPSGAELADGLASMNQMLSSWSNENMMIPVMVRELFTFVSGQGTYTMGDGGDFDTTRPVEVDYASTIITNGGTPVEVPVYRILSPQEWASVRTKTLQSSIPTYLYPEPTFPLMNISFWPVPTETYQVAIMSLKPLTAFANASDDVDLQPGYEEAITFNLAIRLGPEYQREVPPLVLAVATDSKAAIKKRNSRTPFLACDPATTTRTQSRFNIYTGGYT